MQLATPHPFKVLRYCRIARDIDKALIYNYQNLSPQDLYIPLSQIIYVGDGTSDMPCFDVINQYGGISIGVYAQDKSAEEWDYLTRIHDSQKLSKLVAASYEEGSDLVRSLLMSVDYMIRKIALHQIGKG